VKLVKHSYIFLLSIVFLLALPLLSSTLSLVSVSLLPSQAFASTKWNIVGSPGATTYGNNLNSVATVSATDIWAVGQNYNGGSGYTPLTAHWDGSSWSSASSPNTAGRLNGVAAVSTHDVWAVGTTDSSNDSPTAQTLIMHWEYDNTSSQYKWKTYTSPNPETGNVLYSVTAVSSDNVWAVGQKWNYSSSTGFSAQQPLIVHWDGSNWTEYTNVESVGYISSLQTITAISATDIWAVGGYECGFYHTLAMHYEYDATSQAYKWVIKDSPNAANGCYSSGPDTDITGITAISSSDIWATGYVASNGETTFTMHWNGTGWTQISSPNVANTNNWLYGVAAVSSNDVWAVGSYYDQTSQQSQSLTMHYEYDSASSSNQWKIKSNPGGAGSFLSAVAAVSSSDVWAVGLANPAGTFTEHYAPRTPLILIPGVMESNFAVTGASFTTNVTSCLNQTNSNTYSHGELVWFDIGKVADGTYGCTNYLDVLALQPDGQTGVHSQIGLDGSLVNAVNTITGKSFGYHDTLPYLENTNTGYPEYTYGDDFFVFPYDWRKDLHGNMTALDDLINNAKLSTGTTKVDIIAHSMGGLVARDYISNSSRAQKVDTLVELGTPHAGTPQFTADILYPFCIGDSDTLCLFNKDELNSLIQNFTGGFELLPSKLYYQLYSNNKWLYPYNDGKDLDNNRVVGPLNYDQFNTFLSNMGKNMTAASAAATFHDNLDPTYSNTNGVKTYLIAGSGLPTIGQIFNYPSDQSAKYDYLAIDGDSVVATRSATLNQTNNALDDVFYVNQDHGNLVATGSALTMAVNLLNNVTDSNSVPNNAVRKTPFKFHGQIVSVHSPVTLDAYDDQNNHTGLTSDGTIEQNIPGSSYSELGDAKFIYLPDGGTYHIATKATAAGSFDLKIKTYDNSELTKQQLFMNVAQNAQTTSSMSLNTTTPVLSVDTNGDGSNVQQVSPTYTLTGSDATDIAAPFTEASLSPAPDTNGNYSDPTTFTLAATASAGFSVANTYYTVDGGSQQTYSSPFTVTGTGSHTVTYWSVDNVGLVEPHETKTFTIATPISLRSSSSANNGSGGTTLTINVPSGTSNGDVMVAHVVVQTAGNSFAAPSGWTIIKRLDTTTNIATATYWKVAGSSEPSSYTWTFGTSGEASGGIASYTGVNTTNPIDVSMVQYNNGTTNVDNTGVTTTFANDMLVYAVGIVSSAPTYTLPSGFTQEWKTSSTSNTTSALSQEIASSSGATGTIHGTLSSSYSTVTHLIALRPASATPPTPPSGISLRSSSAGNNGSGGTTLVITKPTGAISGDVMVAEVTVHTAGNSIAAPSGWNLVLRQDTGTALSTASYEKVATSSEPSSYTWTFSTSGEASGGIGSYIGVDTTTPVDARHAQYNNGVSNVDNAGVTTITANDMLVYAVGVIIPTAFTLPSGFTDEWYAATNSQTTSEMSQKIDSSTGATGTIHGTLPTGTYSSVTHLIALRPANAPTPTPPSGISLRSQAANNNGGGTSSLTLTVPNGTQSGDMMVAHVAVRSAGNTITAPSGWTQIVRKDTSSSLSTVAYWKVAGSSEPSSYTWNFGTSGEASGGIGSYVGVNTTSPIDASNGQYNSATNNVDNSGVTTTAANDMLVYAVGVVQSTTVNPPSGFTEETYTASNSLTTSEMSQEIASSTGATGTIHATENGGGTFSNVTLLIALKAQ